MKILIKNRNDFIINEQNITKDYKSNIIKIQILTPNFYNIQQKKTLCQYQVVFSSITNNKMPNNFKQQFEDSQANFSQIQHSKAMYQYQQNQDDGFPIQLIRINQQTKKIQLDPKALDIIAQCDLPVGFVSFVGKYRIGKSSLINRLLQLPGQGFKVSNKTKQCTKGIWMWSKPFYSDQYQCYLFFLDTQGTQALSKEAQTDVKLFTLSCLISTYLIFNSVGSIVQSSIQQLNLVSILSRNILISNQINDKQNQQDLYKYMPKFLWLLRDFTLQLNYKSPRDYLEYCLKNDNQLSNNRYQSNNQIDTKIIKNQIIKIFRDRDCFTLRRPAHDQSQLQRLNQLPDHALRRQFIEQVRQLKTKIFKNAQPKRYQGQALLGNAVASMIQVFINSINQGSIPKIKTAWEQVAEDQGAFAYNRALQRFNELYAQNFTQDEPFTPQILHDILSNMKQQSLQQFHRCLSHTNQPCHTRLKQYLKNKQKTIIEVNKQLSQVRNVQLLKDLSMPLMKKLQSGGYKGKQKNLSKDIDDLVKSYNTKAIGQTKGGIISQFIMTLNPILISLGEEQANKQNVNQSKMSSQALQQFQKRQKLLEQQMQAMKNQLDSKQVMLKKRQKQLKDANQQLKKRQTKGCCQIM